MERLPNIHPGEILQHDFLDPRGITAYRLAKAIGVTPIRISEILRARRAITPDTALRCLGTSAELWVGLQQQYDLEEVRRANGDLYDSITPLISLELAA
jgi:addiction module HigA family antidote